MGVITLRQAVEAALAKLGEPPLVEFDDGFYIFRDPANPGFTYDFKLRGDALHWVAHMAQKRWVTTEHLEQFARLAMDREGK